jgi:hypothetical protein
MNQNEGRNRRRFFRLCLPEDALLQATICGQPYDIQGVAEKSMWVTAREVKSFNGFCSGFIYWSDGTRSGFSGDLGEVKEGGRIILNIEGISMNDVVGETRRMLAKFPRVDQ